MIAWLLPPASIAAHWAAARRVQPGGRRRFGFAEPFWRPGRTAAVIQELMGDGHLWAGSGARTQFLSGLLVRWLPRLCRPPIGLGFVY